MVDDQATWCTVPAPPRPRSGGGSSYVYRPPRVAPRASQVLVLGGGESECRLEEFAARGRLRGECTDRVEALQRVLCGNVRMLGQERGVVHRRDAQHVSEAFRIREGDTGVVSRRASCLVGEPALPEVERFLRRDAPLDRVHHPVAGTPATRAGILEERDVAPRRALLVRVEEVVDGRVVLVHRLLHEPEAEDTRVEVDVARGIRRDAGDVMDPVQPHRGPRLPSDG